MRRIAPGVTVLCVLLLSSCATDPFPRVQRVDISDRDPQTVVKRFDDEITRDFEALQSVVISFFGKEVTSLGSLSVDNETRSFNLTCMTPMGARILTIQKDPNGLNAEFAFPDEVDRAEILAEMARDIGRLYFDWTPAPTAALKRSRYSLVFTEKRPEGGRTRFVFGGPGARLIEKQIMDKGGKVVIQYHDYEKSFQGLYPQGIFLKNKKYHYALIIKTEEFHVD